MNKLQQKQEELAAKRQQVAEIFAAGGDDIDLSREQVDDVRRLNKEIDEVADEVTGLRELTDMGERNRDAIEQANTVKRTVPFAAGQEDEAKPDLRTLGDLFVESRAYTGFEPGATRGPTAQVAADFRTLMTTTAGWATQTRPTSRLVEIAQQMPQVIDVVPTVTTDEVAVTYFEETTFTNNAAEVAEAGTYGEAALAYTKRTSPVEKIGVFIPVTDEQLADVAGMRDRINNRLGLMLRKRLSAQVVAGDGNSPNLTGLNSLGSTQAQSGTGIPSMDAIYKAIIKVNATGGFADASAILLHPLDWQTMRLTTTADGIYLLGSPADDDVMRLWGLPVVTSTELTQHTGFTGDFAMYSELAYKAGIEFEVTNAHSTYFIEGKLAIRAQLRAALTFLRPGAFAKITAL